VFNLLYVYVTLLAPKNYMVLPDFWKTCETLWQNIWTVRDNGVLGCLRLHDFHLIWTTKHDAFLNSYKTRFKHPAQYSPVLTPQTTTLLSGGTLQKLPSCNRCTDSNCMYCHRTVWCWIDLPGWRTGQVYEWWIIRTSGHWDSIVGEGRLGYLEGDSLLV
jgi:hypothetical protein